MTRVDELQTAYPGVPREIIIKFETLTKGINDSPALDEVGQWSRSGGLGTYQSYDRGITLIELAEKKPGTMKPGYIKRLGSFHMRNGMGVRIDRDFSSPYRIGKLESGQFALFGEGNVKVALVGGATLMPPNGYKTWQESRDSLIEGVRWMIEHGIFPTPLCMRLGPGSQYGNNPANRAKLPPTEFYLEVALAHDEAMVEYNRYGTMNKLAHCPLDCFDNHYSGDLGILRLAGNMGNWLVGTIPEKAN